MRVSVRLLVYIVFFNAARQIVMNLAGMISVHLNLIGQLLPVVICMAF